MAKYYQGRFKPKNPKKYMGDPTNIIYRSGWEFKLMRYLDVHPDVIEWGSEELIVPYRSPIDGRMHRYFPDFLVKQINRDKAKSADCSARHIKEEYVYRKTKQKVYKRGEDLGYKPS
jgi:hypothetical protein